MNDLRASVLIPTYNRRSFLMQTLSSLQAQSVERGAFEVIVAVDGSTDDTVEALEHFRPTYPLRWITQRNTGSAAASNSAARQAHHEVLIFLDDDQIASPDLVAVHLEVQEQQGPALVQGFYPLAKGYDRRGASLIYQHWLERSVAPLDRQHRMSAEIWSANISLTRDLWARVRGFDEGFREYGSEDTDFGIRIAAIGVPVVFEPRALSYHLHHVSYGAARRQAFSGGKSIVHLARKHSLPIETFIGSPIDQGVTRRLASAWRAAPTAMDALGRTLIASLWAADLLRVRQLQLLMARVLHRYYKVGGVVLETAQSGTRVEHGAA